MPAQCGFELRESVVVVVIHLGHVLDELCLGLAVTSQPVLVNQAICVIVISIYMVLVEAVVSVLVDCIHGAVVNVVIRSGITCVAHPWEERSCSAQRSTPLVLEVTIQIYAITTGIGFLVDVWNWSDSCDCVVPQVLPPSGCWTILPCGRTTVYLSVIPVAIHV